MAENQPVAARRSMRDILQQDRHTPESCIVWPENQAFHFKPGMIQLLPTFHGMDSENPYDHLTRFRNICVTIKDQGCPLELVFLKLFPFSLQDKAARWFEFLPSNSIRTWDEMQTKFLKKFFPPNRTDAIQHQILNFAPQHGETFYQSWERFKTLLHSCPHHGFEVWRLASIFYGSLTPELKQFVETMCNGQFYDKTPEEAFEYFEFLAENAQTWDIKGSHNNHNASGSSIRGLHHLSETDDLKAKLAMLTREIETLKIKKDTPIVKEPVANVYCVHCDSQSHGPEDCPSMFMYREAVQSQVPNELPIHAINQYRPPYRGQNLGGNPYSETYNPAVRNHPNFSWRNNGAQIPQSYHAPPPPIPQVPVTNLGLPQNTGPSHHTPYIPPNKRFTDETLQQFMNTQSTLWAQNHRTLEGIQEQLTSLTQALNAPPKGQFPAQPHPNPIGQVKTVEGSSNMPGNIEQVQNITTLRSGKIIDKTIHPKMVEVREELEPKRMLEDNRREGKQPIDMEEGESEKEESKEEKGEEQKEKEEEPMLVPREYIPRAPFPQRLLKAKKEAKAAELLEVFKQVKINIPLLDAIKQIPVYAKFLKDLCTVKRGLNVKEKAFLTEQASAILQCRAPPKYKDPGCPTISCYIGKFFISRALLDLGASVNLLPYSDPF